MRFPIRSSTRRPALSRADGGSVGVAVPPLCRRFGADVVVTEFLSAEAIRRENPATIAKLKFGADERPIGVQIFGADPEAMGDAAALVTDVFEPEFIDINFGCPVKKVVRRNGGSGCLKDLDLVQQVIRAVASRTHLPVTVKIRSGWNEEMRDPVTDRACAVRMPARAHWRCILARARRCTRARRGGRRSRRLSMRSRFR